MEADVFENEDIAVGSVLLFDSGTGPTQSEEIDRPAGGSWSFLDTCTSEYSNPGRPWGGRDASEYEAAPF